MLSPVWKSLVSTAIRLLGVLFLLETPLPEPLQRFPRKRFSRGLSLIHSFEQLVVVCCSVPGVCLLMRVASGSRRKGMKRQ